MPYVIPQPMKSFSGAIPNLPSQAYTEPREGKRILPIEIAWDGTTKTWQLNAQGLTTQTFSQIVMIDVDNSLSGAPVRFYFPDTQDTLDVPPASSGVFPVFTSQLQVYVSSPEALNGDVTRFRLLNYKQEPISLPPPQFINVANSGVITGPGTLAIIPATVSGTLVGYNSFVALIGATSWQATLKDHTTGAIIDGALIGYGSASDFNGIVFNVSGFNYRFAGGIDLVIASTVAAQNVNMTVRYRVP